MKTEGGLGPRTRAMFADTVRDVDVKRCAECGARFGVGAEFCPFCGVGLVTATWDPSRDPLTGTVIDDRYEVLGPLGEGGMGTVYKVRHVTLNRLFAMKALRRDLATDGALSHRFIHEARATASIKHPAVVAITDFGVLTDGIPYFVMELLVGETLSTRIRARGPLPAADAIGIARHIAEGLAASHAANVIHRDLKPENVFLLDRDDIRIVDFGAAKIVGGSKLTRPGVVFGTPYYMSPEQAGGQPIDARADVYSLGVLMYEMVTGHVPFEADTYMGVLTKHMFAEPPRPSERIGPGARLGPLEDIVLRALRKDPSARYQSMLELVSALDGADRGRKSAPSQGTLKLPGSPRASVPSISVNVADRIEQSVAKHLVESAYRQRKFVVAVAASVALVIALCIGLVAVAMHPAVPPRAPPGATAAETHPAPPPPRAPEPAAAAPIASASAEPPAPSATATATATATASAARAPAARPRATTATAGSKSPTSAPATATAPRRSDDFVDPWQK